MSSTTIAKRCPVFVAAVAALRLLPACEAPSDAPLATMATPEAAPVGLGLGLGDEGPDVLWLQDYLADYGYFPNDGLAERYPGWQPLVAESPTEWGVFDDATERALRLYQTNAGLEATGLVDEPTIEKLGASRCDVPDGYRHRARPGDVETSGFVHSDKAPVQRGPITYYFDRAALPAPDDLSWIWGIYVGMTEWEKVLPFEFEFSSSPNADIRIAFGGPLKGAVGTMSRSGVLTYDVYQNSFGWKSSSVNVDEDIATVTLHEVGHYLGLDHSGESESIMFPYSGSVKRTLGFDDRAAIRALYPRYADMAGTTTDIGVGADGTAWRISRYPRSGGFHIYKRASDAMSWTHVPGGATRVSVASNGEAWIVNSVGSIFHYDSRVESWVLHRSKRARDIAVGTDLDGKDLIWIVSDEPAPGGGFRLYRSYDAESWTDVPGAGHRIAAGPNLSAWITADYKSTQSPFRFERKWTGPILLGTWIESWQRQPGIHNDVADIAVGADGAVWALGGLPSPWGYSLYVFDNEYVGGFFAPRNSPMGVAIDVGPEGGPWIVRGDNGLISRAVE